MREIKTQQKKVKLWYEKKNIFFCFDNLEILNNSDT